MALSVVQSLSHLRLFATSWTSACQSSLPFTISQSLFKFMSIESVMLSNHLILCCPLLFLPSVFPSIRKAITFPVSWLFASGGQIIGTLASVSVLSMNIWGWFPLGLIGLIPCSPMDSQESSPAPQFENISSLFSTQPILWSKSHIHTWLLEKS